MHDQVTSNLHLISTYLIQSLKVSIFRPTCVNDALMMQHHRKEVTMQNDVPMYDNSRNEDKTVVILSILWQLEVFTFCPVYLYWNDIMSSSNRNLFRVTGQLWGDRWIPLKKASDAGLWCFLKLRLNKRWNTQSRRHRAHYVVNVIKWYYMCLKNKWFSRYHIIVHTSQFNQTKRWVLFHLAQYWWSKSYLHD